MRLYQLIDADRSENGEGKCRVKWVGSQSEAASTRKEWVAGGSKRADIVTTEVEVPTSKADLIEFLNNARAIQPG